MYEAAELFFALDCRLPREALVAIRSGTDAADIGQRYLEPLAALQDDDLVHPEVAQFAYHAICNAFERCARERNMDEWTIVNQVLASAGTSGPACTDQNGSRDRWCVIRGPFYRDRSPELATFTGSAHPDRW